MRPLSSARISSAKCGTSFSTSRYTAFLTSEGARFHKRDTCLLNISSAQSFICGLICAVILSIAWESSTASSISCGEQMVETQFSTIIRVMRTRIRGIMPCQPIGPIPIRLTGCIIILMPSQLVDQPIPAVKIGMSK